MRGYVTNCRFFLDTDQPTLIHWYRVPKDRPCLPVASIFYDSDWTNDNGPRATIYKGVSPDIQGEQWGPRDATGKPPRPGEEFTGHYCGTPEQWAGDLRTDRPEDIGEYGCCNPINEAAFDYGFDLGFDA